MFDDVWTRIKTLSQELRNGYAGHQGEMRSLIEEARATIRSQSGMVPPWEDAELEAAAACVNSNWLRAALVAVEKALVVHELSDEEYWGGFGYGRKDVMVMPRKKTS